MHINGAIQRRAFCCSWGIVLGTKAAMQTLGITMHDQFIEGNLYHLPDGTLVRAEWHQEAGQEGTWRFWYADGDLALVVFSRSLIAQTDASPVQWQHIGPFFVRSIRITQSDLTIDDIQPA
jgi:hypothetical protein